MYQHASSARNNSWPLAIFDQFQHLANQNSFWLAKFPIHFQWDRREGQREQHSKHSEDYRKVVQSNFKE